MFKAWGLGFRVFEGFSACEGSGFTAGIGI